MPRTIYERKRDGVVYPTPEEEYKYYRGLSPEGYKYIGHQVLSGAALEYTEVHNWTGTEWLWINSTNLGVDYSITVTRFDSATITILDYDDPDFRDYTFTIGVDDGAGGWVEGTVLIKQVADDTRQFPVNYLKPETTYRTNLVANLDGDVTTDNSIQTFTTPENPIPPAPLNLRAKAVSNSTITLAWDDAPETTAVSYNIYRGIGSGAATKIATSDTLSKHIIGLRQDTKYYYRVAGVNANGLEGAASNYLRYATGHEAKIRSGSCSGEPLYPNKWGSWRPDIGWKLWYARSSNNISVYQGYWQGDPAITGPTPYTIPSQESGRYWGCITYDLPGARARFDQKYGTGVWRNLNVTRASVARVYRMRSPGNYLAQYMLWHLTNTQIHVSGKPPIYGNFRNWGDGRDTADNLVWQDSMKSGNYISNLRLPRSWGKALLVSNGFGTTVNGLLLQRPDHQNNGYGTAGYGEWAGHGQRDRNAAYRTTEGYSDWTIRLNGTWNFQYAPRVAPYIWFPTFARK